MINWKCWLGYWHLSIYCCEYHDICNLFCFCFSWTFKTRRTFNWFKTRFDCSPEDHGKSQKIIGFLCNLWIASTEETKNPSGHFKRLFLYFPSDLYEDVTSFDEEVVEVVGLKFLFLTDENNADSEMFCSYDRVHFDILIVTLSNSWIKISIAIIFSRIYDFITIRFSWNSSFYFSKLFF